MFRLLSVLQPLVGLWHKSDTSGASPTQLCRFQWAEASLQGFTYHDDNLHSPARRVEWLTLGPDGQAMPSTVSCKTSNSCVLRDYSIAKDMLFSSAAEAAAAVACSGTRYQVEAQAHWAE